MNKVITMNMTTHFRKVLTDAWASQKKCQIFKEILLFKEILHRNNLETLMAAATQTGRKIRQAEPPP